MATKEKLEIKKFNFQILFLFPLFYEKKCHNLSQEAFFLIQWYQDQS